MKRTVISGSLLKLFSPSSRIQNRTIPLVSTKMSSNTAAPLFSFNPNLHLRTIDPPVQIGAKWAQSYPSSNSPFSPADASDKYPLLNLAQGVPGHPPTRALLEQVAHQTLAENSPKPAGHSHGYGPVFGDDKIREAVAREVNHFYRSKDESAQKGARNQVNADNVAITAGCNLAFSATAMSLAAPGEAIVVPTPWYFNHFMTLASLGIETIPLSTDGPSFLPSPAVIRNLFEESQQGKTPKIKAIILVTPNNPTGAIYPPALIHQVARLCHEFKVALLMDETYRDFVLAEDEDHPEIGSARGSRGVQATSSDSLPFGRPHDLFQESLDSDASWDWRKTVIQLFSFSKSYAIPGHRLGGVIAHPAFLQQITTDANGASRLEFGPMAKALDNLQVAPPRTDTQRAVAWAIEEPSQVDWRLGVARELRERRKAFAHGLGRRVRSRVGSDGKLHGDEGVDGTGNGSEGKSPEEWGWKLESAGAYYAYVKHPFDGVPSEKVAEALASLVGVVTLPGTFFMPPGAVACQADADSSKAQADVSGTRLRISIANVSSERLALLPERLAILSELWAERGQGWGV